MRHRLPPAEIQNLATLLLGSRDLYEEATRTDLIRDVERQLGNPLHVTRSNNPHREVTRIVQACSQHEGGLDALMKAVHRITGDSLPYQDFEQANRALAAATVGEAMPTVGRSPRRRRLALCAILAVVELNSLGPDDTTGHAKESTSPNPSTTPSLATPQPPVTGPPPAGSAVLTGDCNLSTNRDLGWPVPGKELDNDAERYAEVEYHDLHSKSNVRAGGFKMVRANRGGVTYYWTIGWTGVNRQSTNTVLDFKWSTDDGATHSICSRRVDTTSQWHSTIAVPRYIGGKWVKFQACEDVRGWDGTCTGWW